MVKFSENVIIHDTFGKFEYDRSYNYTIYSYMEITFIINQLRFYKTKIMESHPESLNNLSLFNTKKSNEQRTKKLKIANQNF